jgi:hypothetical protein
VAFNLELEAYLISVRTFESGVLFVPVGIRPVRPTFLMYAGGGGDWLEKAASETVTLAHAKMFDHETLFCDKTA